MQSPRIQIKQIHISKSRCLQVGLCGILLFSLSGCEIGRSFFHFDSDSRTPSFGINLIPSKAARNSHDLDHLKKEEDLSNSNRIVDLNPSKTNDMNKGEFVSREQVKLPTKKPIKFDLPESDSPATTLTELNSIADFEAFTDD